MEEDKKDETPGQQEPETEQSQPDDNDAAEPADVNDDDGNDDMAPQPNVADDADADPDAGPALIEGADGMPFGEEEEKKPENISPEVFADIKKLFEVFDEDEVGYISIDQLFVLMKALDVKPLEEEEEDLVKKADPNGEGYFTMDGLMSILEEKLKATDTIEDLIEQMTILNRGKDGGTIPTPELKQYLTTMGSKFTPEEADEMIKEADPKNDGVVNIEAFAAKLCPVPKEPK